MVHKITKDWKQKGMLIGHDTKIDVYENQKGELFLYDGKTFKKLPKNVTV
jgi:hypothetical protein